jgi:osmoprotectant transport system permease protein
VSYFGWLFDPANWTGSAGIPARLVEHLGYVALAMIIALVIALPVGAWVGHTGRGGFLVVGSANALRALPTLGVLILLVTPFGLSIIGPLIALVVLAVPPLLAGTYAGVRNVDPAVVDAARGMGMRGGEVLWRVELPNALPLIIGGVRSAVLQVISTATIAAYVGLGGLGRYIFDGLAQRDFPQMIGGSLLVALLAIVVDLLLAALQKVVVSPGLQAVPRSGPRRLRAVPTNRPAAARAA